MNVRILIESTWHGRAKKDGVAMWLIEYMRGDIPETRQGFIHARDQTEAAGCLMALINALTVLKKPCNIEITTQCEKLLNVLSNRWHAVRLLSANTVQGGIGRSINDKRRKTRRKR